MWVILGLSISLASNLQILRTDTCLQQEDELSILARKKDLAYAASSVTSIAIWLGVFS
tara:strand:- start:516 stop:689 length:174 start_codon:yes stop_codon:yes gene_type:complete